jgi:hypothetical protein
MARRRYRTNKDHPRREISNASVAATIETEWWKRDMAESNAPAEDLDAIKERLPAVLDQIIQSVRMAIALGRINALPCTDSRVYKRFDNTHAAQVFNLMRTEILQLQLLTLCRLWDQGDQAMAIPRVIRWLKRRDVIADIVARRQTAFNWADQPNFSDANGFTEADREKIHGHDKKAAKQVPREICSKVKQIRRMAHDYSHGNLHRSLTNHRNKVLAHSLEITDQEIRAQERGQTIEPILVGYEQDIIDATMPVVIELNLLMRDQNVSFKGFGDNWSAYAEDYWLRFSGEPTGRQRLRELPPEGT